jgi:hypothetical protein
MTQEEAWKEEARGMVREWDAKAHYYDGVYIQAFDKEEAETLKTEFKRLRPNVPVKLSWYTFRRG